MPRKLIKKLSKNTFLLMHFLIFSVGLIKFTGLLALITYSHFDFGPTINLVCEWMGQSDPGKLPVLLHYVYGVILGFALCILFFVSYAGSSEQNKIIDKLCFIKSAIIYFSCAFLLNVLFFFATRMNFLLSLCWLLSLASIPWLYFGPRARNYCHKINQKISFSKRSYIILICAISFIFFLAFYPLIFKKPFIQNEYMDIPEKTILKNGKVADNTSFVNVHRIGGLIKYDPRVNNGETPSLPQENRISLSYQPMLDYFIKYEDSSRQERYFYDKNTKTLSVKERMSYVEYRKLKLIYKDQLEEKKAIQQLFLTSILQDHFYKKRVYNVVEKDFITKNAIELRTQATAGWFFFHHSWVINPIHAIALGESVWKQPLIYGIGSALTLKKMTDFLGGVTYENYFKATYLFYPLYYILFLTAIFAVFRRLDYLLVAAILLSVCIFCLSEEIIRLAPGYNPMRHIFDVISLCLFYYYLKKSNKYYLYLCLILCLLAVFWSKDFGMCLLLSICGTTIIQKVASKKKMTTVLLLNVLALLLGGFLYFIPIAKNPNLIYLVLGFGTPPTPNLFLFFSLSFILLGGVIYTRALRTLEPMYFLSLSLFLYVGLTLFYFIWNPSHHHLLVSMIPGIFLFLTWIALYQKCTNRTLRASSYSSSCLLSMLIFLYIPSVVYFFHGRLQYNQVFKTHRIYDWNLKNTHFLSTMEPDLFKQSIELINEYEQHTKVYLISKYDSFLDILIDKSNALPTVNLALDLVSEKDIERFFHIIEKNNPKYIFMDTDINRNFNGDIFQKNDLLARQQNYIRSQGRAAMLTNMQRLYPKLNTLYEPIEHRGLLTVFKRKERSDI